MKDGEKNTMPLKMRRKKVAELNKTTADGVILDKGEITMEMGAVSIHLKRRINYAKFSNHVGDRKITTVYLNPIRNIKVIYRTRIMRH